MFWRKFPNKKPKKDGWYQCTIEFGDSLQMQHYVMDLYWRGNTYGGGRWKDNRRQSVFDGYHVYTYGDSAGEMVRVNTNNLCDRTSNVIAWRKLSNPHFSKKYIKYLIDERRRRTA